ncbi:hypothetical protein HMPREF0262_02968 [Clostridium sp. ATCC 29733]|nr:hypothetical protein HMPREF0262_02968 [Clostridium sp. ATCC 29733]
MRGKLCYNSRGRLSPRGRPAFPFAPSQGREGGKTGDRERPGPKKVSAGAAPAGAGRRSGVKGV